MPQFYEEIRLAERARTLEQRAKSFLERPSRALDLMPLTAWAFCSCTSKTAGTSIEERLGLRGPYSRRIRRPVSA